MLVTEVKLMFFKSKNQFFINYTNFVFFLYENYTNFVKSKNQLHCDKQNFIFKVHYIIDILIYII